MIAEVARDLEAGDLDGEPLARALFKRFLARASADGVPFAAAVRIRPGSSRAGSRRPAPASRNRLPIGVSAALSWYPEIAPRCAAAWRAVVWIAKSRWRSGAAPAALMSRRRSTGNGDEESIVRGEGSSIDLPRQRRVPRASSGLFGASSG